MFSLKGKAIAAIDIGTNSVHQVVATFDEEFHLEILDTHKVSLCLGAQLDSNNNISESAINELASVIVEMKKIASIYKPIYRVVGTQALRLAKNSEILCESIMRESSLKVEIIDGVEEARLVSLGMQNGLSLRGKKFLGIDIGGGSTEIIICNDEKIFQVSSIPLGAVILSQKWLYNNSNKITKNDLIQLKADIDLHLSPLVSELTHQDYDLAVVCSGAAKTLAAMDAHKSAQTDLFDPNAYVLSAERVSKLNKKIISLKEPEKIRSRWGLDSNRSRIILAGSSILNALTSVCGAEKWLVSSFGLREGIIIDTAARLGSLSPEPNEKLPLTSSNIRQKSILRLAKRLEVDLKQAQRFLIFLKVFISKFIN